MAKPLKKSRILNFLLYTFICFALPLSAPDQQSISFCLQQQPNTEKKIYYIEAQFSNANFSSKKGLIYVKIP